MGASTNAAAAHGLRQDHHYSILGIHTLSEGTVLIHMRDPLASETYNGEWKASSSRWT